VATAGTVHRTIQDAKGIETRSGSVVRDEGAAAVKDPAVNEAYEGLGATYDLYWSAYKRDSIDNQGLRLMGVVHYGQKYDNAFWDGQEMVFGDGDGDLFNRFTISVDVIGHELTHGVTEYVAGLTYMNQSGALNESISDVFGSLVKQFQLKQTAAKADWLIGAGLLSKKVKGIALRSMKAPGTAYDDPILGKDPQPAHMKDFAQTTADNGGVHVNSGIPNRAFYEAAAAIGGNAWEKAGQVWYETLRDPRLKPDSNFADFAAITIMVSEHLFGAGGKEANAVKAGWTKVGVLLRPGPARRPD